MEKFDTPVRSRKLLLNVIKRQEMDPKPGIDGGPRGDDLYLWDCTIIGPPGTPWEGGNFQLTMVIPHDYPFRPPDVRFKSRVFHPNIYPDGRICASILDLEWSPALAQPLLMLLSIQSILDSPILEAPANQEAANLYMKYRKQYNRKVRAICAATHSTTEDQLSSENGGMHPSCSAIRRFL
ncbi:Ubiquitin-conjugating enzyme [Rhynchospora pubera]|uniref:Ubiquitin-conjugating enzyme n=1 Tax=Rhynchospora pubera TaxID=906938 RepID=A0AAV8ECN7_9POAL|nr:Ubiquitin-conjugating enzyme [Rhynchospora pubera]